MFFYFQARPHGGETQYFWKYYDLKDNSIIEFVLHALMRLKPKSLK